MKKPRRVIAILLLVTLCGFILASCATRASDSGQSASSPGSTANTDKKSPAGDEKVEKVVFSLITFNVIPDNYSKVVDAINKVTREKANVEVDLQLYGPAEYSQKVNLNLQSGAQMDLFLPGLYEFPAFVAKNAAYPLDDLLDKYGKEMIAKLNEDFGEGLLKATTMNGHIYAVPVNKGMAIPTTLIYNADMLKDTGYTADDIKSIEDLPKVFDALKQKHPDVIPFGPINTNPSDTHIIGYLSGLKEIDYLTDPSGVGVVIGNSGKVLNLYETDVFKNGVNMMRDWYLKGYIQKDAATTTTNFPELVNSGRGFCFMGGYSGMEIGKVFSAQSGKNIAAKRIAPFYFETRSVNGVVWMINSATKVPEAAMKFLNLTYTDVFVLNTLLYGLEGESYVKVDEHHIKFPDGKTATDVPYTAHLCSGVLGSESLQYQFEGVSWDDVLLKLRENKETKRSPYFGFIFDPSEVKTELSAINNVKNQYVPGLICGVLDPETTIPKFIKALEDAGANTLIKKKQEQLDKWLSEQK